MIQYENISKIYSDGASSVTALDNVNLSIEPGQIVVLLGPSGCGKTTLLRMTNRLESVNSGRILVGGRDISQVNPVKLRREMGYVIQQIGLFPNKTIAENIATVPRILGWNGDRMKKRTDELLHLLKLDPEIYRDRYPCELSGGQQQRIGVARALAADPDILLMDEPFGAIDPINREHIQDEFLRLQATLKKTIVFVSHDIHEAIKMADKIAIFRQGRLVQYDTPENIITQPRNQFVADFIGSDSALKVLGLARVRDVLNRSPRNVVDYKLSAAEVLAKMDQHELKTCIVLKKSKVLGRVRRKDLIDEKGPVGECVEPLPQIVNDNEPLRDALSQMLMYGQSALCVIDSQDEFAGTITYRHIQNHILALYSDDVDER
jgi:osmoprotectant transport system ATP-binding protein